MLRLLTGAPRSRHQLEQALARRDVPEDVAAAVLDRFTEVGLIDDAEYAQILVRSQRESRGLARRALALELRRRGVGDDDARAALAGVEADDEEATARQLLERRWRTGRNLSPEVRSRRALAMLARKGYPGSLAGRLVREMLADEPAEADTGRGMSEDDDAAWDPGESTPD
ncbi:regulatory protein RecX [Actinotalea sp. AC32]|nr:regulatory protein RecX [Actinotalea sp. AC32]